MAHKVAMTASASMPAHPFFASAPDLWREALEGVTPAHAQKGETIVHHADSANRIWLVQEGWVKLTRQTPDGRETITGLCTTGDFFGEAGLFPHGHYPYYAETLTPCTLIAIPAHAVRTLLEKNPAAARHVMQLLNERLGQAQLQREQLNTLSAAQRLGCFLLKLCREQSEGSISIHIPVEKNELASFLGMKPETFSRSLKSLQQAGVSSHGDEVTIHIPTLRAFVCNSCSEYGNCE